MINLLLILTLLTPNPKAQMMTVGEQAKFDGILFDTDSANRLVLQEDFLEEKCDLKVKQITDTNQVNKQYELDLKDVQIDALEQKLQKSIDHVDDNDFDWIIYGSGGLGVGLLLGFVLTR